MNLVTKGEIDVALHGNPTKSFFKSTYSKYTNFGIQKFRIDYNGQRFLGENETTKFTFKINRYADLLLDTYLVFNLPDIWSPIFPKNELDQENELNQENKRFSWKPYEFKWVENIGTTIIKKISLSIGGKKIQEFSGDYLLNMLERDLEKKKLNLFKKMIGNEDELINPEKVFNNYYPNAYAKNDNDSEPSIKGRTIYVPIHFWFMNQSQMALPLIGLLYNEVVVDIELRPISELFTILDVNNTQERISPNFSIENNNIYRFINHPPSIDLNSEDYENKSNQWDTDIHLLCDYVFLTNEEANNFALNEKKYIIKTVKEYEFKNVVASNNLNIETQGIVTSWMWFLRRTDSYKRNEWCNYTNWKYKNVNPKKIKETDMNNRPYKQISFNYNTLNPENNITIDTSNSLTIVNESSTGIFVTDVDTNGRKKILSNVHILFDGELRENTFNSDVYEYLEKYRSTNSDTQEGLYLYNFELKTDNSKNIPCGTMNLHFYNKIEFVIETMIPPLQNNQGFNVICDSEGTIIGTIKQDNLYEYNYDCFIFEEKYNILSIKDGYGGLIYQY